MTLTQENQRVAGGREQESATSTEMRDLETIELLIATKTQTAQAMDNLAHSLQARLTLLNDAMTPALVPNCANCSVKTANEKCNDVIGELQEKIDSQARVIALKKTSVKSNIFTFVVCAVLILAAFAVGRYSSEGQHQTDGTQQTVVKTETLEEFATRESEHLTADERRTLIVIAEKVLSDPFTTPSEMREAFRYERLKAGITSSAFLTFSDKWAAKVSETAEESVESMRSIYESLLRGLKIQAYSDFSEGEAGANLLTPSPVQRQRSFRR